MIEITDFLNKSWLSYKKECIQTYREDDKIGLKQIGFDWKIIYFNDWKWKLKIEKIEHESDVRLGMVIIAGA